MAIDAITEDDEDHGTYELSGRFTNDLTAQKRVTRREKPEINDIPDPRPPVGVFGDKLARRDGWLPEVLTMNCLKQRDWNEDRQHIPEPRPYSGCRSTRHVAIVGVTWRRGGPLH